MTLEKRKRRLIFSWTTSKGVLAILMCLIVACLIEYFVIVAFSSYGLTDNTPLTGTFKVPETDFTFTVSISPIFHLIPLGVLITLLSSWMHLTMCIAAAPPKTITIQKRQPKKKSEMQKRIRFKQAMRIIGPLTRFLRHLTQGLRRISFAVKSSFGRLGNVLRVNKVSSLFSRSHFARAAIKGSAAILSLFAFLVFALYMVGRPAFLSELIFQFCQDNPHFQRFISGIREAAQIIAQFFSCLGLSTPFLDGLIAPLAKAMMEVDVLWKYLICQNIAVLVPALLVLLYGRLRR